MTGSQSHAASRHTAGLPREASGFASPSLDQQAVFRAALDALSRPGTIVPMTPRVVAPAPLGGLAASLVLALADYETAVWLDAPLAASPAVADFIRFHTGARVVAAPDRATFAVVSDPMAMPPLSTFHQGDAQYPDRSTTLIVEVEELSGRGWRLEGPGIDGTASFGAAPLPADFLAMLAANRSAFPLGIDILLAGPTAIAGLPRSVRISEA